MSDYLLSLLFQRVPGFLGAALCHLLMFDFLQFIYNSFIILFSRYLPTYPLGSWDIWWSFLDSFLPAPRTSLQEGKREALQGDYVRLANEKDN